MTEKAPLVTVRRYDPSAGITLDAQTRQRLGRQLQAMYDPVIDEALDPRLAELMRQLDSDRSTPAAE